MTLAYSVVPVPEEDLQQQNQLFEALLQELGKVSTSEVQATLTEREYVEPEAELTSDVVARLRKRIEASPGKNGEG